MTNESFEEFI